VQHAEGGTVREVKVRDGQQVQAGEPLLVLGDVTVDAEVNRLGLRVLTERAGIARMEAEQAGLARLDFGAELEAAAGDDVRVAGQLAKERALFIARRDTVQAQVALLRSQRERIDQETQHLRTQVEDARNSLHHQEDELARNQSLLKEGFIAGTRISQLEANVADYRVKIGEREADLARAAQRMVDTELRMKSLEGEYRQQASDQLKAATARLVEIEQELRKSADAARRQVITAPSAGTVVNLHFTSPGAVIQAREPIADIVPTHPRLLVEAQIQPEDIERVHVGQAAHIRLSAFHPLTTPMVDGKVFYVAADRLLDRNNGRPYYVVQVEPDAQSLRKAGDLALQAGMPAEVFIRGRERTPLQYLAEPVTLLLRRAGRER
jgi:HlyD family type I secretion membrane fusion protein